MKHIWLLFCFDGGKYSEVRMYDYFQGKVVFHAFNIFCTIPSILAFDWCGSISFLP